MTKHHLYLGLLAAFCAPLLLAGCSCKPCTGDLKSTCTAEKKAVAKDIWPDRELLRQSVIAGVPGSLAKYHPETGKFGTEPWNSQDQYDIFPLAVAWGMEGKDNPWYHNPELLKVIAKAGDRLVDEQDEKGMWVFRKKDNSTWGMIHMPWTYTRWIRAYNIVKDHLPADSKAKWEKGLLLGYKYISQYCQGTGTHNITTYHAAGLYVAGIAFGKEEWKAISKDFMHRLIARQSKDGYWTEHFGPVVNYNFVYLEALGIYYHYSKDPVAKEALTRGARFHASLLWPDGSAVSVVDERNHYTHGRKVGNVGFSCSPEGRRYLIQQLSKALEKKLALGFEFAAIMLQEGDTGEAAPPPQKNSRYLSQDGNYSVSRSAPYQWAFSAYACKPVGNRWIMDRQAHVEIGHDDLGVIGSGGNTKMQPYYSTFTFGDPDSFQPDYSTPTPNFFPKSGLRYIPDAAKIDGNTLSLTYGKNQCSVTAIPNGETMTLEYRLTNAPDAAAAAHFPVVLASAARDKDGKDLDGKKIYTGKMLGNKLQFRNGIVIEIPEDAQVRPAVSGVNPYDKYGKSSGTRLVITLPLSAEKMVQKLVFSRVETNASLKGAQCLPAAYLPHKSVGAPTKLIEEMDAVFLRGTKDGGEVTFTITQPKAATRELHVDLLGSYTYGIVQVLVNGKEVGKPFSTYRKAIESGDPRDLGKVDFKEGENTITFRIVGKEPESQNYFTSIRNIYLK